MPLGSPSQRVSDHHGRAARVMVAGAYRGCSQLSTRERESKEDPEGHTTIKGLPLVASLPARPHLQKALHLSKQHHPGPSVYKHWEDFRLQS